MGTEAVDGLTGGETENPNVSNGLAGFACSPLPAREQIWLPDETRCQPQGSPAVSAAGKWVNASRWNGSRMSGSTWKGSAPADLATPRPRPMSFRRYRQPDRLA